MSQPPAVLPLPLPQPPSYDDTWLTPPDDARSTLYSESSSSASNSSRSANDPARPPLPARPRYDSSRATSADLTSGSLSPNPTENINGEIYFLPPRQQLTPVIYNFIPHSFNSMLLASTLDNSPLYHISVHLNCFIPSSYLTILSKGTSPDRDPVASFEMGLSAAKSSVTLAGKERCTDLVLVKAGSKSRRIFQWQWHTDKNLHLSWLWESPVKYCYLSAQLGNPNMSLLASFTPQPLAPRADGAPSPPPALKLFPDGAPHADHIVLSALILERQRLAPVAASGKPLFG